MKLQCPNCKRSISLTTSQVMNRQSKITCPGCRQTITLQSSVKSDVDKAKKQIESMFK